MRVRLTSAVRLLFLLALCVSANLRPLNAQVAAGEITGIVKDQAGAVIPGATVTVTNVGTNRQHVAASTGDGVYTAPSLPSGEYRIDVELQGFKPVRRAGIRLSTGEKAGMPLSFHSPSKAGAGMVSGAPSNGSRSAKARMRRLSAPFSPGRLRPRSAPRGAPSTHAICPDASHSQRKSMVPVVAISRASLQLQYPARFQLIAAMNPCPCGHLGDPGGRCRCAPPQIARYRARISGPLLDRIDIRVEVPSLASE